MTEYVNAEPVPPSQALALLPIDEIELAAREEEGTKGLAALAQLPVSLEVEQVWSDLLCTCRERLKALEEDRKLRTDPIQKEKTRIDKLYRPAKSAWEQVEAKIREALQTIAQLRLDSARKARELAAEAAAQGDVGTALATLQAAREAPAVASGVSLGACWEVASFDVTKLPEEWLTIHPIVAEAYMAEHRKSETIPDVPGVVFRRVATVRAR